MTEAHVLQLQRLMQLLGMARRAGKIAQGFDATAEALTRRTANEVFVAADCAARTQRNIQRIANEANATVFCLNCTREQLGRAIGCPPTGVLALLDRGFAQKARTLVPHNSESMKEENVYDD